MILAKKFVFLLLVTLVISAVPVISGEVEEMTLKLVSNPYTITRTGVYHTIAMEGFFTRGPPGDPALPQKIYDVEMPSDALLQTVHMYVLSQTTEELAGSYEIGPAPLPASGSRTYSGTIQNGKNIDVYTNSAFYPETSVELVRTYQMREKKYVRIQFTPFRYNPVTKTLVLTHTLSIRLRWNSVVQSTVSQPPSVGYAIVTTNAIVSNSTLLQLFMTHLQAQGYTVCTVTENQYGAATGQQRAINMRNWLQANCLPLNIKYVLLIGDPDPDDPVSADSFGDVPMMMCWPNPGSATDQTPTDYFYADLTGMWDSDGDTMYGEFGQDLVDFGPEVYVGRIPVYGADYSGLDAILGKFINYTGANTSIMIPVAISNYRDEQNGTNGCVPGWVRTDGLNLPQQVLQNITDPAGFTNYVTYEASGVVGRGNDPVPGSAYGHKAPLNNANVVNQWASDYGIVFWWAHGSPTGASRKYWAADLNNNSIVEDGVCGSAGDELAWPNFLASSDTAALPDMETFTFQASCLNGHPETSTNLQYSLLRRGAVSTVRATRISWYAQGTWTFMSIVDNAGIGYNYVGYLVFGSSAGEALYRGKNTLANPWGWVGWMNLFDFNLYGDPSMYLEGPVARPPPPKTPEPPPVNWSKLLCPLAKQRVDKARDLLEEAKGLLEEAKKEGKDVSEIEKMIAEAEDLIGRADKYCSANNCIPGNFFALRAIEILWQVIEKLSEP